MDKVCTRDEALKKINGVSIKEARTEAQLIIPDHAAGM